MKTKMKGRKDVLRKPTLRGQVFKGVDFGYEQLPEDRNWLADTVSGRTRGNIGAWATHSVRMVSAWVRFRTLVGHARYGQRIRNLERQVDELAELVDMRFADLYKKRKK